MKNKILFSILGGLLLLSTPVFATTTADLTVHGDNPLILNVGDSYPYAISGLVDPSECSDSLYDNDVFIANNNVNMALAGTYYSNYTSIDRFTNHHTGQRTIIVNGGAIPPQTASVFSFVDRGVSNGTGASTSAIIVPAVSNLWPLMLIVIGIILTFYVLDKLVDMFKNAQKEKKKLKIHNDYGGKVTRDDHGNVRFIEFDRKK